MPCESHIIKMQERSSEWGHHPISVSKDRMAKSEKFKHSKILHVNIVNIVKAAEKSQNNPKWTFELWIFLHHHSNLKAKDCNFYRFFYVTLAVSSNTPFNRISIFWSKLRSLSLSFGFESLLEHFGSAVCLHNSYQPQVQQSEICRAVSWKHATDGSNALAVWWVRQNSLFDVCVMYKCRTLSVSVSTPLLSVKLNLQ